MAHDIQEIAAQLFTEGHPVATAAYALECPDGQTIPVAVVIINGDTPPSNERLDRVRAVANWLRGAADDLERAITVPDTPEGLTG